MGVTNHLLTGMILQVVKGLFEHLGYQIKQQQQIIDSSPQKKIGFHRESFMAFATWPFWEVLSQVMKHSLFGGSYLTEALLNKKQTKTSLMINKSWRSLTKIKVNISFCPICFSWYCSLSHPFRKQTVPAWQWNPRWLDASIPLSCEVCKDEQRYEVSFLENEGVLVKPPFFSKKTLFGNRHFFLENGELKKKEVERLSLDLFVFEKWRYQRRGDDEKQMPTCLVHT